MENLYEEDDRNFAIDVKAIQEASPELKDLLDRVLALRDTLGGRPDHNAAVAVYRELERFPAEVKLKTGFVRAVAENWHMVDDLRRSLGGKPEPLMNDPVSCLGILFTLRGRQALMEEARHLEFNLNMDAPRQRPTLPPALVNEVLRGLATQLGQVAPDLWEMASESPGKPLDELLRDKSAAAEIERIRLDSEFRRVEGAQYELQAEEIGQSYPGMRDLLEQTVALRETHAGQPDYEAAAAAYSAFAGFPSGPHLRSVFVQAVANRWHLSRELKNDLYEDGLREEDALHEQPLLCLARLLTLRGRAVMAEKTQKSRFVPPVIG